MEDLEKFKQKFDWLKSTACDISLKNGITEVHILCFTGVSLHVHFHAIAKLLFDDLIQGTGVDAKSVRWFYHFDFETEYHRGEAVFKVNETCGEVWFEPDWKDNPNERIYLIKSSPKRNDRKK